jgi:hexosaminidase
VLVSSAKSGVQRSVPDEQTHLFAKVAASTGPGNIWPAPQSWSAGAASVSVAYPFTFTATTPSADLVVALQRFNAMTFSHRALKPAQAPAALLSELKVTVANLAVPLQLGVDESYELTIPADGSAATLTANTYYGALRGLETFSQLVNFNYSGHGYIVGNAPWSISDAPRFSHRGVMIDTARHFEPVTVIKTVIDSLTYAKFNTLHWHVVDSQVSGRAKWKQRQTSRSGCLFFVSFF